MNAKTKQKNGAKKTQRMQPKIDAKCGLKMHSYVPYPSVCPPVCPSVCPSVHPSVCPPLCERLFGYYRIGRRGID